MAIQRKASLLDDWTVKRGICFCISLLAMVGCYACKSTSRNAAAPIAPPPVAPIQKTPAPPNVSQVPAGTSPRIRVAVAKDLRDLTLSAGPQGARVLNSAGQLQKNVAANAPLQIFSAVNGFGVDGGLVTGDVLQVESVGGLLKFNGQAVSTRVHLHRNRIGTLTVVAHLDLEDYLAGVLAGEVPYGSWHPEAMKAQAVASRSYAWYHIKRSARLPYDVENTTNSQVFKAGQADNPVLANAVSGTRGQVLTSNRQIFPACFHSTCGGQTCPASAVFPDFPNIRPLNGAACTFCTQSHTYRWRSALSKQDLTQKLRASYPGITRIDALEFVDAAGHPIGANAAQPARAATVRVKHAGGTLQMPSNDFRLIAGGNSLKSMLLEQVIDKGTTLEIAGGGFGHGVGLCQYGSQGMAKSGHQYLQILGQYYPGAELTRIY